MSVSPVGFDVGETHEALIRLRKAGFTPADLNRIAASDKIAQKVMEALRSDGCPITVDYGMTLEQMIAAGNYDLVNSDITSEFFPIVGTGKVELEARLEHYGRNTSSEAVLADLDQKGLRPATLPELLAFGAKYPEVQCQHPVIALGSIWQLSSDGRYVPYIDRFDRQRYLYLHWFESDWSEFCRFLAFRK